MDPQEVHDLGKREVARIWSNMEKVKNEVNFNGTLQEFFQHMRDNKSFYNDSKEHLLKEYRDIVFNHINPKLHKIFSKFPEKDVQVRESPVNDVKGMYVRPSTDGSRPGVFFVNLNSPEERPRFTMVAFSLHEANPGHHFQRSRGIAADFPRFRKEMDSRHYQGPPVLFPEYTSYCEGWALYSEYLGEEIGAYRDQYDLFGRYLEEIHRAARLVVDTGIHVFGWSRQQAIDYMMDNTCDPREQIEIEIDRYITWPGQACGYKIGEIKIKELRKKSEEILMDKFDVKEFHEVMLRNGALPHRLLDKVVTDWINEKKAMSRSPGKIAPGSDHY